MRLWLILAALLGGAVAAALIVWAGSVEIAGALAHVGWGLGLVVGFHLLQILASALAWRTLLPAPRAPLPVVAAARSIREAVNNLLFVAQIGGEFVGARVLQVAGASLGAAAASVTVDLTMEMVTQIAFTVFGLLLLLPVQHQGNIAHYATLGIALATAAVLAFATIQRSTLFKHIERGLLRVGEKLNWVSLGELAGMHEAIRSLYAAPKRLGAAFGWHLVSWLLGGFEVMLILQLVGVTVGLRDGLVIESLGQAMRALGFFIPASLGVQEGGYLLICGALGIAPISAIELSLLKRVREVVLGAPALIAWQVIEGRRLVVGRRKAARLAAPAAGD